MKGSHYTVALLSRKDFLNTRRTRRSDSISLVLSHENSDTLTEPDLANAETSSNYFSNLPHEYCQQNFSYTHH